MRIVEEKWTADIIVSPQSEIREFMHFTARVEGVTSDDALNGAQLVLDLFAKGRNAVIRVTPEVTSDTDFNTKETRHQGFVRFSMRLEAGTWHRITPSESIALGTVGIKS